MLESQTEARSASGAPFRLSKGRNHTVAGRFLGFQAPREIALDRSDTASRAAATHADVFANLQRVRVFPRLLPSPDGLRIPARPRSPALS